MKVAIIALALSIIALGSFAVAYSDSATELHPGWNLVAWTGEQIDAVEAAYGWNPTTQLFDRYFPDRPDVSTLTQLDEGQAYWILASESAVLSAVEPSLTPCPECPGCPSPIFYCPTPQPTGPTTAQQREWCSNARSHAASLQQHIYYCDEFGWPCTYDREELAEVEKYLNAYCR